MAIDDLLDEHEQGERVRAWLRNNGAGIIGGVALGLALIWGVRWWQDQQLGQRMAAGSNYQAAVDQLEAGKLAEARPVVASLPEGTYATLAALQLAEAQLGAGKRDEAIATLRGVDPANAQLAGVVSERLARLLLDAGKPKDALALLQGDAPGTLGIRGDAYAASGDKAKARDAYARALVGLEVGSPERNLVELKLSEVGGSPAQTEAGS
jgi:predicted negative regulator of RcsB-dependent stress response